MERDVLKILSLDQYLPVMSDVERTEYALALLAAHPIIFSKEQVARWASLLSEKNKNIQARFDDAILRS